MYFRITVSVQVREAWCYNLEVYQFRYRPGVAQKVPGSYVSPIT